MATGLIDIMKCAAMDAADTAKFADLKYGNVISESPLKIQISNDFTIPESLLIVPEHLTNYTVPIEIEWTVGESGGHSHEYDSGTTETVENHTHELQEATMITIHNALQVGDRVALLRQRGGLSYFVLGKV